ncbi:MAG: hypothetical protein KDC99_14280 [Cyclobacteriaceae bacterium]|nr:hypothetical protein [Cyclobacteriaceae bacterium]
MTDEAGAMKLVSDRGLSASWMKRIRLAFYLRYNRWKPLPDFSGTNLSEPGDNQWYWFRRVESGHINISPARPMPPERLEQDRKFISRYRFLEELLNNDRQFKNACKDDMILIQLKDIVIPLVFEQKQWVVVPTYHTITTYESWRVDGGKVLTS